MVTQNGPFSLLPYYLRLTKDGNPNAGTTCALEDGGPSVIDQRKVADGGFLELVGLGMKSAYDVVTINSLHVVDAQLATTTPYGTFGTATTSTGTAKQPRAPRGSGLHPTLSRPMAGSGAFSPENAVNTTWRV